MKQENSEQDDKENIKYDFYTKSEFNIISEDALFRNTNNCHDLNLQPNCGYEKYVNKEHDAIDSKIASKVYITL